MKKKKVYCLVCKKKLSCNRKLIQHLKLIHKINKKEYYDEYLKINKDGKCLFCKGHTEFNEQGFKYKLYCKKHLTSYKLITLEHFIIRYGAVEGNSKYNLKIKNSKLRRRKKKLIIYLKKQKTPFNLKKIINKFNNRRYESKNIGEKNGNYKAPAYFVKCICCNKKIRRTSGLPKLKKYFCNIKCKSKWQAEDKKEINKLQIISKLGIEASIKKYGSMSKMGKKFTEKGLNTKIKNGTLYNNLTHRSKIADDFTEKLAELLPDYKCYYGDKEYFIRTKDRMYFYDFECRDKKVILEFNGDYFHANPERYKSEELVKLPGQAIKAKDIWEKDELKLNVARSKGFTTKVVWEKDYRDNPEKVLTECHSFIEEA